MGSLKLFLIVVAAVVLSLVLVLPFLRHLF